MKKKSMDNGVYAMMFIIFLLVAISFVFDVWGGKSETNVASDVLVDPEYYTKEPVRQSWKAPIVKHADYTYNCNDCHKHFETSIDRGELTAHKNIELNHGIVTSCLKCHSTTNREKLLDLNQNEIPFAQSEKNCYQCHGPIYRDWESGVHGRMSGFWDASKGDKGKLSCVECHDPHSPQFPAMKPAPAPADPSQEKYRETNH